MNRSRTIISLAVVTTVVVVLAVVLVVALTTRDDSSPTFTKPTPVTTGAPKALDSFYQQKLEWDDCGAAQCAAVKVPVDYERPDGETTTIQVKVFPSSGGDAERSLFVNPGGPGGSAIDFADTMHDRLGDDVLAMYDIVGVDPRGVGASSPLKCLDDQAFDDFVATDPDPDDTGEITALRASLTSLGEACRDQSGALGSHVSTVEVARDMDIVRALLGRKTFDWFGASYGTQLGAVYAELFPDRVGRMVLDGAVDPSQTATEASFAQTTGFQRALVAYAEDCVASSSCPLGDDVDAGLDKITDLLGTLDAEPLPGPGGRELTEGQAFYGIAVTLYDKDTWTYLTRGLEAAFKGDGSVLLTLSDAYFEREPDGSYATNGGQVIYAVSCLDSPDGLSLAETKAELPRFTRASSVFGPPLAWGALGCTDWPLESANPLPEIDAKGAPPIVVIGTTRDPATPYESAEALAAQLDSGVLLTRDGDGHTAYLSGNECIVEAVDGFLTKGDVPPDGKTCT
ncbi:MAG: hypothetical protein JWP31_38 [Aeromicrobium sp.]|nr:hypothetical protein [Aeromicrobium sp.]